MQIRRVYIRAYIRFFWFCVYTRAYAYAPTQGNRIGFQESSFILYQAELYIFFLTLPDSIKHQALFKICNIKMNWWVGGFNDV